jgi:hypothetical protein
VAVTATLELGSTLAEPRTLPTAVLQEALPTSTESSPAQSVWAEWLADLTPRDAAAKPAQIGGGSSKPGKATAAPEGSESPCCVRTQADDAAGPRRDLLADKENAAANIVEEKKPEPRGVVVKKEPGVLRGRRVLSMDGNMCTLSLFERSGEVRVEAAMRIDGKLLRGGCAVPNATTDAWAVWARTDVRVLDSALSVAYT